MRYALALGTLDIDRGVLWSDDGERTLSPTEVALIRYLAGAQGRPVPQDELLTEVWGYSPKARTRTVRVTINRLRNKVEADPAAPVHLLTEAGAGYRWAAPSVADAGAPTNLVGRDEPLKLLRSTLEGGATRLTLVGPVGVGKSHLARVLASAPGAVVVDLSDATDAEGLVQRCAAALGGTATGEGMDVIVGTQPKHLVVLDDADGVLEPLRELLTRWQGVTVVVTARAPVRCPGEHILEIEPLTPDDARILMERRWHAERLDADTDGLQDVVDLLEGLPLSLVLAASWAGTLTPADLAERLRPGQAWLQDATGTQRKRHQSLTAALAMTLALLPSPLRTLLRDVAVFRGGFRIDQAEQIFGPAVLVGIKRLRDHSLLLQDRTGRMRMLAAVRGQVPGPPDEGAMAAHARVYTEFAEALPAHGPQFHQALDVLDAERANLLSAHAWARHHDPELAVRLARAVHPLLERRGPGDVHLELLRSTPDTADILAYRAGALHQAGRTDEAMTAALGAVAMERSRITLKALARIRAMSGDFDGAKPLFQEALGFAQKGGVASHVAECLYNLALLDGLTGGDPRGRMGEAIALLRPTGDVDGMAIISAELAEAMSLAGDDEAALALLEALPEVSPSVGAQVQTRMGGVLQGLGRHEDALVALDRAWDFAAGKGAIARRAVLWRRIGVEVDLGHPAATETADLFFDLAQQVGDDLGAARTHQMLSLLHLDAGDPETSRHHHDKAMAWFGNAPPSIHRTYARFTLATGAMFRGERAQAIPMLEEVLDTAPAPLAVLTACALGLDDPSRMPLDAESDDARALIALSRARRSSRAVPTEVEEMARHSVLVRLAMAHLAARTG